MSQEQDNTILMGKKLEFIAPSGNSFTLREQNGADDDILSNPSDAKTMMNISNFISSIVVKTNATKSGKLTPMDAHNLPVNDRYAILINSRINSLGEMLEFPYDWGEGGKLNYEVDLRDYLVDYSEPDLEKLNAELALKPEAVPVYPKPLADIDIYTNSGKHLKIDCMTGAHEAEYLSMPVKTKNTEFVVRNLKMKVGEEFQRVTSFHLFTTKDMVELRKAVKFYDPTVNGTTEVENPTTNEKVWVNILGVPDFFYPGEM